MWASQVVLSDKEPAGDGRDAGLTPGSGRFPWRRVWQLTSAFLPGESKGQTRLVGCGPLDHRVRHDWSKLAHMHTQKLCVYLPSLDECATQPPFKIQNTTVTLPNLLHFSKATSFNFPFHRVASAILGFYTTGTIGVYSYDKASFRSAPYILCFHPHCHMYQQFLPFSAQESSIHWCIHTRTQSLTDIHLGCSQSGGIICKMTGECL